MIGLKTPLKLIILFFKKNELTFFDSALEQIEEKQYNQELLDRSIKKILFIGLAFEGKKVLIRHKFKI